MYYLIVKFYVFYSIFLFSTILGVLAFYCSIAWRYIAWLPLSFTVIGQNNQLNIYYQSEILSSPHRITAYGSAQPIQTLFVADEVLPLVIFVHQTVKIRY